MARTVIPAQGWVVGKNFEGWSEEYPVLAFVVDIRESEELHTGAVVAVGGRTELVWPDGVEYQLMREETEDA